MYVAKQIEGVKMKLLLNYENIESEINDQLQKLKMLSIFANDKNIAAEIGKCVAQIHSCEINQNKLPLIDAKWATNLIRKNKACECKNEIISALEFMEDIECHDPDGSIRPKCNRFIAWNIENSNWQSDYESGHFGSYAWDIMAIINHANDPEFSDAFLGGYMHFGGKKAPLVALYANLYYAQAAEAAISGDFSEIIQTTRELMERQIFDTELISSETINRLHIKTYRTC